MELIERPLAGFPQAPLRAALGTDTGRVREHNEDSVGAYVPPTASGAEAPVEAALVVADGVGGHDGGDWASRFVVDAIHDTLAAQRGRLDGLGRWLDRLLHSIHDELLSEARSRGTPASLGSTATLAVIQGRTLVLAHVGDSRAYRLRNGHLVQLTEDDSWVAEQVRAGVLSGDDPEAASRKNVLTQCLGIGVSLRVQIVDELLSPGDRYLLCSDGLHGVVPDGELATRLAAPDAPGTVSARLIDLANERGGPDNISAVVFDVGSPPEYAPRVEPAAPGEAEATPKPRSSHVGAARRNRRAGTWMTAAGALIIALGAGSYLTGSGGISAGGSPPGPPAAATPGPGALPLPTTAEPIQPPAAPPGTAPSPTPTPGDTAPEAGSALPPDTGAARPDTTPDTTATLLPPDTSVRRDTLFLPHRSKE